MRASKYTEEFLRGKKYHWLTFVSISHKDKDRRIQCKWLCDCGKECTANVYQVIRGQKKCCGCNISIRGKNNPMWNGIGEIPATFWTKLKSAARVRKLKVSITFQYLWELFLQQHRRCALTGLPLQFASQYTAHDGTASVDRIDSTFGYIEGNVQWVHKEINWMKGSLTQTRFIDLCKKVASPEIEG